MRQRIWTPDMGVEYYHAGRPSAGGDWWDPDGDGLCIWAAYQPKGAASFAASLVDLSGNGNDAADPGGANTPGWDAVNGWTFGAGADYLITTFVPQNDQSQTILVQFTNATTGWHVGISQGGDYFGGYSVQLGFSVYCNGGDVSVGGETYGSGNFAVAGNQGYKNGIAHGGAIGAWGGTLVDPVWIGGLNFVGFGLLQAFDGNIQALAIYDCVLTAPQVLAIATAMAAL